MTNHLPTLGNRVRNKITGFTRIVTSYAKHLAGCDRLWVEPPVGDDGKSRDGQWCDIDLLEIVEARVVADRPPTPYDFVKKHLVQPVLVVMSRESEREIMREDYSNVTGLCGPRIRTEPTRVYGIRVAYDDSLPLGEFLISENLV